MNLQSNIECFIGKYLNGTITTDEYGILTKWLSQSDENQLIFDQIREIWLATELADGKNQFDFQAAFEKFKKKTIHEKTRSRLRQSRKQHSITVSYRWAVAVVLMAVVGGMILQYLMPQSTDDYFGNSLYQEITVPYGARSNVLLPDGSRITLNAGTTLRYHNDFGRNNRDLWLDGEGYFVVNKSATPFTVHTGTIQIQALGTQFNVRAYSSEQTIETTLVEGKVAVSDSRISSEQEKTVTLLPNQKLIATRDVQQGKIAVDNLAKKADKHHADTLALNEIIKQENIDPLPEISWKDNEWVIYRENLGNLAVKLERRFDVKIVFDSERLKSLRYNGTLPDESLEQVLNVMGLVSQIGRAHV